MIQPIIPVWKKMGQSTHKIAKVISEKYGVKTSHTGTLDPMAEGVVIVLTGETRLKKYEYANWSKEYEFEISFGLSTDSGDGLGLIVKNKLKEVPPKKKSFSTIRLTEVLKSFEGAYKFKLPIYSAKKVKGKPLHWYAREGKDVTVPEKEGFIYEIKLLERNKILLRELCTTLISKINMVAGDLRQTEIINQWNKTADMTNTALKKIDLIKIKCVTSKGVYVRAIAQDFCDRLGATGFVFSLVRSRNGIYTRQDCIYL